MSSETSTKQIVSDSEDSDNENDLTEVTVPQTEDAYNKNCEYSAQTPRITLEPPPTESQNSDRLNTIQTNQQRYWKINFFLVMIPLIFWGIPIHLLLSGRRGITTTKEWFKEIFFRDHPLRLLLTYIFFIAGLCINGFFLYTGWSIIYSLVYKGKVQSSLFTDIINLFRTIPVILPLDLMWIWGYSIRKLLLSFDRITYPELDYCKSNTNNKDLNDNSSNWKSGWTNVSNYRFRLFMLYLLFLVNQGVHLALVYENNKSVVEESIRLDNWIDFFMHCMYNLMLPCYIMIVWAIQFEFDRLSLYMKSLIALKVVPDFGYFAKFKTYFKQVGNHVMLVNDICNVYFSWVFIILCLSSFDEAFGFTVELFILFLNFWGVSLNAENNMEKVQVRIFVGNLFGVLFQALILALAIWFIICANDKARLLHVRLNDFVSEPYVIMTPELYNSFRMLKNYMHSRMETERPALLTISAVSMLPLIPCCSGTTFIYHWMMGYRVLH